MPIYEYECDNCKHKFEILQKMSDEPTKECPKCKQLKLIRVISAPGIIFKGPGFYCNDYKGKQ